MLIFVITHKCLILQEKPRKDKPETVSSAYTQCGNKEEETDWIETSQDSFLKKVLTLSHVNVLRTQKLKLYHKH